MGSVAGGGGGGGRCQSMSPHHEAAVGTVFGGIRFCGLGFIFSRASLYLNLSSLNTISLCEKDVRFDGRSDCGRRLALVERIR